MEILCKKLFFALSNVLLRLLLIGLLTLIFSSDISSQNLWECDNNLISIVGHKLVFDKTKIGTKGIDYKVIDIDTIGRGNNAIGYRKFDDSIYGITYRFNGPELFKLSNQGEIKYLKNLKSIVGNSSVVAGCITPDDNHLLIYLNDNTGSILRINLESNRYNHKFLPIPDRIINDVIVDIDIDPFTGLMYCSIVDSLAIIDIENNLFYKKIKIPGTRENEGSFPSLSINSKQVLTGFDPGEPKRVFFYHIPTNFFIDRLDDFNAGILASSNSSDGCSCLTGTFELHKTYSRDTINTCQDIFLTLKTLNYKKDFTYSDFRINDVLPAGMTFEEVVDNPSDLTVEGLGTNEIDVYGPVLKFGLDSITFRISVSTDAASQTYYNQAQFYGCQSFKTGCQIIDIKSDYPETYSSRDETPLEIIVDNLGEPEIQETFYKCVGESVLVDIFPGLSAFNLEWFDGDRNAEKLFEEAGIYDLTLTYNCEIYEYKIQVINTSNNVDIPLNYEVVFGKEVTIDSEVSSDLTVVNQSWFVDGVLIEQCEGECLQITYVPSKDEEIRTTILDEGGCTSSDVSQFRIIVEVFTPNIFTPNGDGFNDIFFLQTPTDLPISEFFIYDRWGNVVFSNRGVMTNDIGAGWDGRFKGSDAEIDVYVWKAFLDYNDQLNDFSGDITLVR